MKQWIAAAVVLLSMTMTFPTLAASWETAGFYSAKGKLIRPGMLMQDVLNDAGEPLERKAPGATKVKKEMPGTEKPALARGAQEHGRKEKAKASKAKEANKIEIWTYRRSDGVYSLLFGGGRLTRIDVAPFRDP